MSKNDSPAIKAGATAETEIDEACATGEEWCPGPLARPTNGTMRCFECFRVAKVRRLERTTARARMHATQALSRTDDEPKMAREHLRQTLSLLDALEEEL